MTNYKEIEGCVKLWRNVINQSLHDLGSKDLIVRQEAEEWFCPLNEDFLLICEFAFLDPKEILELIDNNKDILTSFEDMKTKIRGLESKEEADDYTRLHIK